VKARFADLGGTLLPGSPPISDSTLPQRQRSGPRSLNSLA
jgi:hypothetical protein